MAVPDLRKLSVRDLLALWASSLRELKDRDKWTTTLGSIEDVRRMMETVWTSQLDRHGTDDDSVPLNASPEQADAAFSTCLNLVRLFAGGHVQAVATESSD